MKLTRRTLIKAGASAIAFPTIISRASAQDAKQLHVGVYNSALGKLIQKEVIPKFEAEFKCRVFTIEGATLSNIAALRATRDTPRFSMMMMDDVGIPHLDLTAFVRFDPYDHSRVTWAEARYHWRHAGLALQWQRRAGDATSDFAPWPVRQSGLALVDYYF